MSKARTCNARCHNARGPRCDCWCGGAFHGAAGGEARERFTEKMGFGPEDVDPEAIDDHFEGKWKRSLRSRAAHPEGRGGTWNRGGRRSGGDRKIQFLLPFGPDRAAEDDLDSDPSKML